MIKYILNVFRLAVEKEDTEEYRRREEEAEKIAREIESSTAYKNNVDKELSDNEEEEQKFSAVVRTTEYTQNTTNNTTNTRNNSNEINNNNKEASSNIYQNQSNYNQNNYSNKNFNSNNEK